MSSEDDKSNLVAPSLYAQTYSDLENLQTQLPEEAVVSLAREVILRLARKVNGRRATPAQILELSLALIGRDPKAAARLVEQHHKRGVNVKALYLEYISPAADQLGTWWDTDHISFADVTVGIGRTYAIMRSLSRRFPQAAVPDGKTALFASVPGDQHILGLKIAADLARKEEWTIDLALDLDHDALLSHISEAGHTLIGLSAGGVHAVPDLARLVLALRVSEPSARIVVSGQIAEVAAESVQLMHVDAMSPTFEDAMGHLNWLWQYIAKGK